MSTPNIYLRIILVSILVAVLGLAPSPHAASRLLNSASQSITSGDLLNASRSLAAAAQYFPWRSDINIQAGHLALKAGDPTSAIQYFERPGTISHLSYEDKIILGDAYSQSGDVWMAEAIWKSLASQNASGHVYERLASFYFQQKDYSAAILQFQNLLTLDPSNTQYYYQIGTLYAATNPDKALPFLAQAEQLDPLHAASARLLHDKIRTASLFDDPAYSLLIAGRQLANSGDWELAAAAFQNAIDFQPDYVDAWAFLGEAHSQIAIKQWGTISTAGMYELQHALMIDPNSVLANTFMGLYYERHEDYSNAKHYIEQAIHLNPTDSFLYSELGNIYGKSGDLPLAQYAYETAIQNSPQDPLFYRLLAEYALEHQIQIRELALPAARQAVTLDPNQAASLDILAQVMLELHDFHSAERLLLKALQADPGFTLAYLHLGTAYLYLGEPDLALHNLDLAKATNPDSWIASQAQRMLDYYFP